MSVARQQTGRRAEMLAAEWLMRQGLEIVDRNVRTPLGELDLIAREGRTICVIEVRSRRSERFGTPEESVTAVKRQHIQRAALWYLRQQGWQERVSCRFDVIAVRWVQDTPHIKHIPNAFEAIA
jgi:putative endonuclease